MKNPTKLVLAIALAAGLAGSLTPRPAHGIPAFKKQFDAKYVKKDGSEAEKALAAAVDKAKCNVCHVEGKKKTERNAYGEELAKLLDKKADEKDEKKIQDALDKVFGMKVRPDDPSSPTYGDMITEGKLPGVEEAK